MVQLIKFSCLSAKATIVRQLALGGAYNLPQRWSPFQANQAIKSCKYCKHVALDTQMTVKKIEEQIAS